MTCAPSASAVPPPAAGPPTTTSALHSGAAGSGPDVVVILAGEVDLASAPAVRAALGAAIKTATTTATTTAPRLGSTTGATTGWITVAVDTTAVTFIDCAGLGELLFARAQLRAAGHQLLLPSPAPAVRRLLAWTALSETLTPAAPAPRPAAG